MSTRSLWAKACTALSALALLGMKTDGFAYGRDVQSKPGWSVLELPADTLAHAAPNLADLRLHAGGNEIPWLLEEQLPKAQARYELQNVEMGRDQTTALVDRGEHPVLAAFLSVEVPGNEPFLKPVVLEASDDKQNFRVIATSSIFRVQSRTSTTVRFAPNDRRYLRLRLDDRNSGVVRPVSVVLESPGPDLPSPAAIPAELTPASNEGGVDRYTLELPSAHLPVLALRFTVDSPAFSRRVSVYERVLFRDVLSRRLVGEGAIFRAPGGESATTLPLADFASQSLELEVERAPSSLPIKLGEYIVARPRIVFLAPDKPKLELLYGAPALEAPKYDLAQALAHGQPPALAIASLGAEQNLGPAQPVRIAPPPRAPLDDAARWPSRTKISLPAQGNVAYLDLEGEPAVAPYQVRILDAQNRQVPYILESTPRTSLRPVEFWLNSEGKSTSYGLGEIGAHSIVSGIELEASAPDYFSRSVEVYETGGERKGETWRLTRGSANWVHQPNEPKALLRIPLARPHTQSLYVDIDKGDNVPVTLSAVRFEFVRQRIDFVFQPGDDLSLLWGNGEAAAPSYDFALLTDQVLASSALPASAKMPEVKVLAASERPRWFWLAPVFGAAVVLLVLARTLRAKA